ncbi:hypothetical protein N7495_001729 [Penicillium taxi]|uniref:uncharacterized protein n=1 Tax=Penicillium taxi TaxID=168475 RepID=UPI002545677B|nr:uncharacterized protein N7495_001729 [Penicillium taxi]KAJ5909047.1 hypothetical protein N7495_001729 [Penicillium taxi]
MSREDDSQDKRYAYYQRLLQTGLAPQDARGVYQHIIRVSETDGYRKLQDLLRRALFKETKNPLFQPVLHLVQAIYGFSGLSESDKSRLAEEFCSILGTRRGF